MNSLTTMSEHIALMVCSYCKETFKKTTNREKAADDGELTGFQLISHGICPNCLLKNFPQEYLMIQKDGRQRIKKSFKNKYVDVTHAFSED